MESTRRSVIIDTSEGSGLEKYGTFVSRYPEICPLCFSKYPDDADARKAHIIKCSRLARQIRDEDNQRRR